MSVSSHLTPEPERRLWLILESMQGAAGVSDAKLGALAGFCAVELAAAASKDLAGWATVLVLGAAVLVGLLGFAPLKKLPGWLQWAEPPRGRLAPEDCLVAVDDIAKYSHGELINKLDRYLGGGITATQYYEDIVGQILAQARLAARKRRLLELACALAGAGQVLLLLSLLRG